MASLRSAVSGLDKYGADDRQQFRLRTRQPQFAGGDQKKARRWFIITSIVGAVFIASQVLSWLKLVSLGYYASGNPYAGFFYILTAIHAIHVTGGIGCLTYILLKTQNATRNPEELLRRQWFARVVGWYWHFMGVLWVIIFLLLGLYK